MGIHFKTNHDSYFVRSETQTHKNGLPILYLWSTRMSFQASYNLRQNSLRVCDVNFLNGTRTLSVFHNNLGSTPTDMRSLYVTSGAHVLTWRDMTTRDKRGWQMSRILNQI